MSTDTANLGPSAVGASRQRKSGSSRGKYAPQACQECRRRRAKCNGSKPSCLRCTERRLSCVYANDIDHRGSAPRSLVSLLQNRIKLLEEVLLRHSIDIEASIAQIQGGESRSEEPRQETCNSSTSQPPNSGQDLQKPELQGALYSEQPGSGLHPVGEDQMRFFGPASGRLDLQPSQAAMDGVAADGTHADDRSDQPQSKRVNNPSQERFNAYSQSLAAEALRDLSPELVEHPIDLYFEWEQPWFQIVDEELFRASRMQNGRYYSPVLLCCIIAVASRYSDSLEVRSDPQDANTAGLAFTEHAEALIHFDLKWPSITTIQSLAIMAIFYVAIGCDAAGWLHHGMASRLIIDMGLNIDTTSVAGSACLNARDIKLRRQIYWSLYCSDKLYASYTGRVCTMLDSQGSVPLPGDTIMSQGLEESVGTSHMAGPGTAFLASFHRYYSTHCQILESILTNLYAPKQTMTSGSKEAFFNSCLMTLQDWLFSLPRELRIRPSDRSDVLSSSPQVFILHMVYHTSLILLAKPFVPFKIPQRSSDVQTDDPSESSQNLGLRALHICREAATEISQIGDLYREGFGSFRCSPVTATHCTLTACLVNLYLVDKGDLGRTHHVNARLASCLSTLRELGDSWTPARRYWETLKRTIGDVKQVKNVMSSEKGGAADTRSLRRRSKEHESSSILGSIGVGTSTSGAPMIGAGIVNDHAEDPYSAALWNMDQSGSFMDLGKLDLSVIGSLPWDYALESSSMDFW